MINSGCVAAASLRPLVTIRRFPVHIRQSNAVSGSVKYTCGEDSCWIVTLRPGLQWRVSSSTVAIVGGPPYRRPSLKDHLLREKVSKGPSAAA